VHWPLTQEFETATRIRSIMLTAYIKSHYFNPSEVRGSAAAVLLVVVVVVVTIVIRDRNSVVAIATRYGLDNSGFEFRWRREFSFPSRQTPRPTQSPIQCVLNFLPGGKATDA
jgi:hypothetical protein